MREFFDIRWRAKSAGVIAALLGAAFLIGGVMRLFGVPAGSAGAAALFTAGLAFLCIALLFGKELDSLVPATGIVFIGISVFVLVFDARRGESWIPGLLVMIGVAVVGPTGAILGRRLVRGTRMRARTQQRDRDRRELARQRGWRFQETDPDLLPRLGSLETKVSLVPMAVFGPTIIIGGQQYSPSHHRFSAVPPAQAILAGQADGVPFWVFDFDQNRRRSHVRTAWLAELPQDLPYLGMPIALCSDHWTRAQHVSPGSIRTELAASRTAAFFDDPYSFTETPEFAREVMTPEVRAFTAQWLRAWWIDGRYLATIAGYDSAPADLVAHNVRLITQLARLLPKDVLARWARPPQPAGTGSQSWLARSLQTRQPGRQATA